MKRQFLAAVALSTTFLFTNCTSLLSSGYNSGYGYNMASELTSAAVSKLGEKTVRIDHIPTSVEEFEQMQLELAKDPEGAVMMVIVSMEMYRRDHKMGEECIRLANVDNNFNSMMSRVKELYRGGDSYGRPYQAATFFKGATPMNGYNPTKPYTIRVRKSPTHQDERSQSLRGYVKYMEVYSDGFDTHWRSVEVVQQKGCEVYKVSNCPSIYTQCKEIYFESNREFEGL